MSSQKMNQVQKVSILLSFALLFLVSMVSAQSWTQPTATPPGNNALPPLNTTSAPQFKIGGLSLGTSTLPSSGILLNIPGKASFNTMAVSNLVFATGTAVRGKVLTVLDSNGTIGLGTLAQAPTIDTESGVGVYTFSISFVRLMQDAEFRTWYAAQANGTQTLPNTNQTALISNDRGFASTVPTARKICSFFSTSASMISYTTRALGSGNNNQWWFWNNTSNRWEINSSSWNNSTDMDSVNCLITTSIQRGAQYALSVTNIPYANRKAIVCTSFSTTTNNVDMSSCVAAAN